MMKNRNKPWAPPHKPASRKRFGGLKRPPLSQEAVQQRRVFVALEDQLNSWANGEPIEVEMKHETLADVFIRNVLNLGFSSFMVPSKPNYKFHFTRSAVYDNVDDVFDTEKRFDFGEFLKQIPDLKGQIIGGHTVVWGHTIRFRKFTNPIVSKYGDTLSENAGMGASCTCGWNEKDILPLVQTNVKTTGTGKEKIEWHFTKPSINYLKLEQVIMEHIQGTYEEVDYVVIPLEFLENAPNGFVKALLTLLKINGAIMHFDFDTRNYLIIDDNMPDSAIAELTEMLAGYEVGTRKVKVLRYA